MIISGVTEQPRLAAWAPAFHTHTTDHYTVHEGVYHSPHGTVHCVSERSTTALPGTNVLERTQLRMVYAGLGWQALEFQYADLSHLPILASAFARMVAAQATEPV